MKLYGFWRSLATYRVKVALALKGMKVDEVSIDILKGMQHQPDYKALNPQAVVPSLVLDEGGPPSSRISTGTTAWGLTVLKSAWCCMPFSRSIETSSTCMPFNASATLTR